MSEDLQDEITSINAIYTSSTLTPVPTDPSIYALILPSQPDTSLRIEFPRDYPDAPPSILGTQHVGSTMPKGAGQDLVDIVRTVLADIYVPGSPCVFDLIEESAQKLQQLGLDQSSAWAEQSQIASTDSEDTRDPDSHEDASDLEQIQDLSTTVEPPSWILSEVITEKKSIFVARAAAVTSVDMARSYLSHLLSSDKKVAKATHNITAWRIRGAEADGVQYQDCDDDGETAAGGRLLHLLELMGVWNTMVVVTRWYGGVQLGPDRFRIINQTARDAVVKAGFAIDSGKEKKKGKK
jgi:hypothetical protein